MTRARKLVATVALALVALGAPSALGGASASAQQICVEAGWGELVLGPWCRSTNVINL